MVNYREPPFETFGSGYTVFLTCVSISILGSAPVARPTTAKINSQQLTSQLVEIPAWAGGFQRVSEHVEFARFYNNFVTEVSYRY